MNQATKFIVESNQIEGILRPPTKEELDEFYRFMALDAVNVDEMKRFVKVYQPNALLRDRAGLDVIVGSYRPVGGGRLVFEKLAGLLDDCNLDEDGNNAFLHHVRYERLHPFTDGNGRSGRMLWAWQMRNQAWATKISFLHRFYYQALNVDWTFAI